MSSLDVRSLDAELTITGTSDDEIVLYLMLENLYNQLPAGSISYIKSSVKGKEGQLLDNIVKGAGFVIESSSSYDNGTVVIVEKKLKSVGYWWSGALIVLKFLENAGYRIEGFAIREDGRKVNYPNFF